MKDNKNNNYFATKGFGMTPTASQHTPLMIPMEEEKSDADKVLQLLENDNDSSLQQLLRDENIADVLRPPTSGPSADTGTSLHTAAELDAKKCLKVLLENNEAVKALEDPDDEGATALLVAVANARPGPLQQLLEAKANINARKDNGLSALHLLVLELCKEKSEERQSRLEKVTDVLFSQPHVNKLDLEPDASQAFLSLKVATPLAAAADKVRRAGGSNPRLRKLCEKLVVAGASIGVDAGKGETVEQVFEREGWLTPELRQKQRQPPPQRPTAAHVVDEVFKGVSKGEGAEAVKNLLYKKSKEEKREAVNSRLGQHTLLWLAVENTNTSLVKELLEQGADPKIPTVKGELPLHCAAYAGHVSIFNELLEKMKEEDKPLDLTMHTTSLVRKLMLKGKAKTKDANHMACFRRLLENDVRLNLNQREKDETALHVAASFNNQEAVSEVLRCGGFLGAERIVRGKSCGTVLGSVMPATLERAMDGCITHYRENGGGDESENVLKEDYTLQLDYRFLLPPQQEGEKEPESVNEMKTLMDLCRSRRHRRVILHPLVQTLLYAKWRRALLLYIINLAIYFFFVVMLTIFVYRLKDLRVLEARLARLQDNGTVDTAHVKEQVEEQESTVNLLMGMLLIVWLFMLVREGFQIVFSKEFYLKSIENYLEWFLLVVVLVLCAASLSVDITRHLAAWAMIVAWYEFVLVLGRAPPLSLYITMLRHVSWNILKVIFLFSALILAFTISFNIILQPSGDDQNEDFSNFWSTLPKAIVMSTGEFEYSDLSEKFPKAMVISAVLVFLVFLFLIFLVLMNVMNGLAVTDTQEVKKEAELYSLTSRLELVYLVESLFLVVPFLRSHIGKIQLLSGPGIKPFLRAKINHPKKNERLLSGRDHKTHSKLDGDTTECLRIQRLQYMEELNKRQSDESAARLDEAVQDLSTQHPELLCSLAAALRSRQ